MSVFPEMRWEPEARLWMRYPTTQGFELVDVVSAVEITMNHAHYLSTAPMAFFSVQAWDSLPHVALGGEA